jgi:hypothetical protein
MLVCDTPVAIDLAQAHSQSEQKAVLVYRTAGQVRSAPHDGDRKSDVCARGNGEFPKVEGRTGLVVTEKQIPGLFVGFDAPALKWRRQVEHHHVPLMVRKNGGKIVPPDSLRPTLEKGFDPGFFGVGLFRHGSDSLLRPQDERRLANPTTPVKSSRPLKLTLPVSEI